MSFFSVADMPAAASAICCAVVMPGFLSSVSSLEADHFELSPTCARISSAWSLPMGCELRCQVEYKVERRRSLMLGMKENSQESGGAHRLTRSHPDASVHRQ